MPDKFSLKGFDQIIDNTFKAVSINVASPERIRSWSYGEIKNPETINYLVQQETGNAVAESLNVSNIKALFVTVAELK